MGVPAYSALNLLQNATLFLFDELGTTTLAHADGFDTRNLIDGRPGTTTRPASQNDLMLVAEFPAPVAPDFVALINHGGVADPGVTVELLSATTLAGPWTTIADLTVNATARDKFFESFAPSSKACWAIRVTNTTLPFYVGELWLGSLTQFGRNHAWGSEPVGVTYLKAGSESEFGVSTDYFLAEFEHQKLRMPDGLTTAERTALGTFWAAVKGGANPMLWVPDTSDQKAWVAKLLVPEFSPRSVSVGRWDGVELEVREVTWGRPVA